MHTDAPKVFKQESLFLICVTMLIEISVTNSTGLWDTDKTGYGQDHDINVL